MATKKTKKTNSKPKDDSAMSPKQLKECLAGVTDIATSKFDGFIYVAKEIKPGVVSGTIFAHQFSKMNALKGLVKNLDVDSLDILSLAVFVGENQPEVKAKKK